MKDFSENIKFVENDEIDDFLVLVRRLLGQAIQPRSILEQELPLELKCVGKG